MRPVPLVILAGSDRSPTRLPESGRDKHPLTGHKGIDVRIGGRPLVATIVERAVSSGCFDPVYVAGPESVYCGNTGPAELIDVDSSFAGNIRRAMTAMRERHPGSPIGFTVCDILPDVETLRSVMADYWSRAPFDFWFPMIRTPDDLGQLGASSWKPIYRIVPEPGEPPLRILPGHLAVVDPAALRLEFLYRLMELGYRTRNRSIAYRRTVMVRGVLWELLYQDILHLLALRAPTLTWTVLTAGLKAGRGLKRGTITRAELEKAVRKVFITREHTECFPERRTALPVLEGLSLALDMDTEEEARAMGGDVSNAC